jgi:Signal peptide peptidase
VASILLIVAFFYDIFFVFVTPYLFHGKSVMITVATSGGPPKADEVWCEKYPHDKDCAGGNPLPMLLAIPKLFDYVGGSSLLGLGDIVLPGLLLSFAARLDAAKCLLGVMGGGRGFCRGGYYGPLVVAYAVGLAMANTAVYVMNMGQPALLYLVPCCLGTLVFMGWRRQELQQLWDGPNVLRSADEVVSGTQSSSTPTTNHVPLALEEGTDVDDVLTAPHSAIDEDDLEDESNRANRLS